jgi:hypothetical protein
MSIKVDVTVEFSPELKKALEDIKKPIDRDTAQKIGDDITADMKRLIASGQSPIKGNGRFPAYKDPKKYPGKRKSKTPVNLELTGEFLDDLTSKAISDPAGYATRVTYDGQKSQDKERGHREGANGQPKRPTLPAASGEDFAVSIKTRYTKTIRDRIIAVLKGKG